MDRMNADDARRMRLLTVKYQRYIISENMRAPARARVIDVTIWGSMIAATLPQAQAW